MTDTKLTLVNFHVPVDQLALLDAHVAAERAKHPCRRITRADIMRERVFANLDQAPVQPVANSSTPRVRNRAGAQV